MTHKTILAVLVAAGASYVAAVAYTTWLDLRDKARDERDPWARWDGSRGGEHHDR